MYLTLNFNIVSTNIFFPLGKMIGIVRLWIIFILSSQSWEIGSPFYRWCRKDEVVLCPAHIGLRNLTHLYVLRKDSPQSVSAVSVLWQFATFWWSAIIWPKQGRLYLVEETWWNQLDSITHFSLILKTMPVSC